MKKSKILAATLGLMLLGASVAHADDRDYYEDHEHGGHGHYEASHRAQEAQRQQEERRHHWARGEHLSKEYVDKRYIVSDWKVRHLHQPPRGYHWYRADDQYVLVRSSDSIISDILDVLR
ncbi:MAG: RcnB family protein [Micavibrio sp.]|nr:RcnB family protein [Micavibrio sp.]